MMTLTTYDEKLCQILEPNVCTTYKRFLALKKLNEAGILKKQPQLERWLKQRFDLDSLVVKREN